MERKKKDRIKIKEKKNKGNNLFSVVVNYQKMWSKIKNKVSFNNR
jgi:hypothetical protein